MSSWRMGVLLFQQFHKLTFRGFGKDVAEMSEHPLQRLFWGAWAAAKVFAIEPLRCGKQRPAPAVFMAMLVPGIDEVFGDNAAGHL